MSASALFSLFFDTDTHTHTVLSLSLSAVLAAHKHARTLSITQLQHPHHWLPTSIPLASSSSYTLWPQRLILPTCPSSAVCRRGHAVSAGMATSQQDSGFFDISIKSLLKSLGGSEYG